MPTRSLWKGTCLAALMIAAVLPAAVPAQVCGPELDGRVAAVDYRDTVITWDPVVEYEKMVLTIGGPCEDIVKVFGRGEPIFFDLREIERVGDGMYTWELRREATVGSATKKALAEARKSGDDRIWWSLFQQGAIPAGPYVDSESFTVVNGVIVPPDLTEGKSQPLASKPRRTAEPGFGSSASYASLEGTEFGFKDQVIPDDLIVQGSTCVGFDCVNGTTFDDSTILMRENNTRIKFDDTSTISGFPTNDWEIQANSSASGGGNFLAINDCGNSSQGGCADDPLFKIEAGARANALYVESDGDVGVGTANPVLDLHIVTGNTPGIRLDQDSSGGFSAQSWDVAGNETSFFIRDVTAGSRLPFRIRPGAPTSSIDIASDGDVGIGTASPNAAVDIVRSTGAVATLARFANNSGIQTLFDRTDAGANDWQMSNFSSTFQISIPGAVTPQFSLAGTGNLTIAGTLTELSTREAKTNFEALDPMTVLARLDTLPISVWTYKEDVAARHMGPVAEDFYQAFGLGANNKTIAPGDKAGVALAAVQGLNRVVAQKDQEIGQLEAQLGDLQLQNQKLEARLAALEALLNEKLK